MWPSAQGTTIWDLSKHIYTTKVVVTASWHLLLTNISTEVPDRTPRCTVSYARPPAAVEGGVGVRVW